MRNYKPFKKIIIILSILIVILAVLVGFIVMAIRDKEKNIITLQSELTNQSSESQYLISMQKMVNSADTYIDQIDDSILQKDGDVAIIELIEKTAQKNNLGVTIDLISEEDIPDFKNSGITALRIKARTNGSWINMYKFVSELESLPYKVKIEKFSLISNPDATDFKKATSSNWQNIFEIKLLKYK